MFGLSLNTRMVEFPSVGRVNLVHTNFRDVKDESKSI